MSEFVSMLFDSSYTESVVLVLLEMCLAVIGIVCNMLVVATVRNTEDLQTSTHVLVLTNLCFSNLTIAFLVKPISAIYVGYSMSTGQGSVGLAFCSLFTLTYRTTWCILPATIIALCWQGLLSRCSHLTHPPHVHTTVDPHQVWHGSLETVGSHPGSNRTSDMDHPGSYRTSDMDNDAEDGEDASSVSTKPLEPTVRQKVLLGSMWIFSGMYGLISCFADKLFKDMGTADLVTSMEQYKSSRDRDVSFCPIRPGMNTTLDQITVLLTLVFPLTVGPSLVLVLLVLSLPCSSPGWCWPRWLLVVGLLVAHLASYPAHLVADTVFPEMTDFNSMMVKYAVGFSFVIVTPLMILAAEPDLRDALNVVFNSDILCAQQTQDPEEQQQQQHDPTPEPQCV